MTEMEKGMRKIGDRTEMRGGGGGGGGGGQEE